MTSSITYDASAQLTEPSTLDAYHDVPDIELVPLDVEPMLPSTQTITLEVTFDTLDDGTNRAMFNGQTYNMPLVPTAFSQMSLGSNANTTDLYGPYAFVLNHLEVVDIVLENGDAGKHPL